MKSYAPASDLSLGLSGPSTLRTLAHAPTSPAFSPTDTHQPVEHPHPLIELGGYVDI